MRIYAYKLIERVFFEPIKSTIRCIRREINDAEDTMKLQRDSDRLGSWARKWGMRFQPVNAI